MTQDHIPILSSEQLLEKISKCEIKKYQSGYLAMYSSLWGGIVTDPRLMQLPIDDHIVHRGDGVFEAIKCREGGVYLLDQHLDRLEKSAQSIGLAWPYSKEKLRDQIVQCLRAAGTKQDLMVRLYMSRGPGGFTTNPYESVGSQVYIVITKFSPYSEEKYQNGVNIGFSHVLTKEPFFARIKSCNYLQNVLMKKEALDRHFDFTIGVTPDRHITESSTENIAIRTHNNEFLIPRFENILRGTTLVRLMDLMRSHQTDMGINFIGERDLTVEDLKNAREAFMIGTTLDVLPVGRIEGREYPGLNAPDSWAKALRKFIVTDMQAGPCRLSISV